MDRRFLFVLLFMAISAGPIGAEDRPAPPKRPDGYHLVGQTIERCGESVLYVKQTKTSTDRWGILKNETGFVKFSSNIKYFYWDCGNAVTNDGSGSDEVFNAVHISRRGPYREVVVLFLKK